MASSNKYKSRWQLEEEDHARYRKHNEKTFQRRMEKLKNEGYKCTFEGCQEKFDNQFDLNVHVQAHNQDCWNQLKCNQPKCGKQFKNKRLFQAHIEEHKAEALKKCKMSIRSTLLLNKHGILMEEFEREFRTLVGRPLPLKMFGVLNITELVEALPDVMKVVTLSDGSTLIQGVADENTTELANSIQLQRYTNEGFNFKTGQVLLTRQAMKDLGQQSSEMEILRAVPESLKKQVRDLISFGDLDEEGVSIHDFQMLCAEVGGDIVPDDIGYYGMEDLVLNGLNDLIDVQLDNFNWKIVPKGCKGVKVPEEAPMDDMLSSVKKNISKLLEINPYGVSINSLISTYIKTFGPLQFSRLKCKDMMELCLLMPDVCKIDTSYDVTILPAGSNIRHPHKPPLYPLYKLGEVKIQVKSFLTLSSMEEIPYTKLAAAYENYYGGMNTFELRCDKFYDVLKLMPDVVTIRKENYKYYVSLRRSNDDFEYDNVDQVNNNSQETNNNKLPFEFIANLHKMLSKCPDGVPHSHLYRMYVEVIGDSLVLTKYGYSSITSLLRSVDGKYGLKFDGSKLTATSKLVILPKIKQEELSSGWVKIIKFSNAETCLAMCCKNDKSRFNFDLQMEFFYFTEKSGRPLEDAECFVGQTVAAVFTDSRIYRGAIEEIMDNDLVKIRLVDNGKTVLTRKNFLFWLDEEFTTFPEQAVQLILSTPVVDGEASIERLEEIVERNNRLGWLQIENNVSSLMICDKDIAKVITFSSSNRRTNCREALVNLVLNKIETVSNAKAVLSE